MDMLGADMVKLDAGSLGDISGLTGSVASKLGTPIGGIGSVISSLDWKVKAEADIEQKLNNLKSTIQIQESSLRSMRFIVDEGVVKLDSATSALDRKTSAIAMKAAENVNTCMGGNNLYGNWLMNSTGLLTALSTMAIAHGNHGPAMDSVNLDELAEQLANQLLGESGTTESNGGVALLNEINEHGGIAKISENVGEEGNIYITCKDGTALIRTKEEYQEYLEQKHIADEEERRRAEEERKAREQEEIKQKYGGNFKQYEGNSEKEKNRGTYNDYVVLDGFDTEYVYDQHDTWAGDDGKEYKGSSYCCQGVAVAIGKSVKSNQKVLPGVDIKDYKNPSSNYGKWLLSNENADKKYNEIYNQVIKGNPVMVTLHSYTGASPDTHFVTCVGLSKEAIEKYGPTPDFSQIQVRPEDILVADPADGKIKKLSECNTAVKSGAGSICVFE